MRILYTFLHIFSAVCLYVIHWLLTLYYFRKRKIVPLVKNPLLLKSATQLAKDIREGKLKSVEVVQAYITRIKDVEPYINATVDHRFQEALDEAKEADLLVASGLRCTGGSKLFEDLVATEDAPSVAVMKKAGAIVITTTNSPEFAMNMETTNHVHGRTSNPYDTNRIPGGSSGGECSLIASGGSVLGLGNDLLGSVRIPSHFSGVFGHKPTQGLVPNEGSFPPERLFGARFPQPLIMKYFCTGPICRYAEDLVISMKVLSTSKEVKSKLGTQINFHKLKICYLMEIQSYCISPVDPEISRGLLKTVSYFEREYGIKAKEVKMPWFNDGLKCMLNAILTCTPDITDIFTSGKGVDFNLKIDLLKSLIGRSKLCFSTLAVFNFAYLPLIYRKSQNSKYEKEIKRWINEFHNLLDEDTVLLLPTMPFTAPYHREGTLLFMNVVYTGIFNILGLPSTCCPIGFNEQGLPIGIQIVGCKNNDPLTIACAIELEKVFGGWKAPGMEKNSID